MITVDIAADLNTEDETGSSSRTCARRSGRASTVQDPIDGRDAEAASNTSGTQRQSLFERGGRLAGTDHVKGSSGGVDLLGEGL